MNRASAHALLANAKSSIAELSKQLKREQKRQREPLRCHDVTDLDWRVTFILHAVTQDAILAGRYLLSRRRRADSGTTSLAPVIETLSMLRHDRAPAPLRDLLVEDGAAWNQAWPIAARLLRQFQAERIAMNTSTEVGVAITTRQLVALVGGATAGVPG